MTDTSFNPRSRMGSDDRVKALIPMDFVSIHAPAWGATLEDVELLAPTPVSIHAPAWGATCDAWVIDVEWQVSIHAPAWGATNQYCYQIRFPDVSIHAPAWGATPQRLNTNHSILFQSTLPHGERRIMTGHVDRLGRFQSTLPHGERRLFLTACLFLLPFQSTLPHGERQKPIFYFSHDFCFNPRSRMGSDIFPPSFPKYSLFQSTLPHGERLFISPLRCITSIVSIHAPAWGATSTHIICLYYVLFQSTLPHGERL